MTPSLRRPRWSAAVLVVVGACCATTALGATGAAAAGPRLSTRPTPALPSHTFDLEAPPTAWGEVRLLPLGAALATLESFEDTALGVPALRPPEVALATAIGQDAAEASGPEGASPGDAGSAPATSDGGSTGPGGPEGSGTATPGDGPSPALDLSLFPRARGIQQEVRVFWYAAGASALTSLGVRVLAFIPAALAGGAIAAINVALGPAATLLMIVALVAAVSTVDAALAGLAAALVYDQLSDFYDSSYIAAFGGQFLGTALALGVASVLGGFGAGLIFATTVLADFVGIEVSSTFLVFSVFGMMPAIVIGFFASVALPALFGAWAVASTARPREGLLIDPDWNPLAPQAERSFVPSSQPDREAKLFPIKVRIPGT